LNFIGFYFGGRNGHIVTVLWRPIRTLLGGQCLIHGTVPIINFWNFYLAVYLLALIEIIWT